MKSTAQIATLIITVLLLAGCRADGWRQVVSEELDLSQTAYCCQLKLVQTENKVFLALDHSEADAEPGSLINLNGRTTPSMGDMAMFIMEDVAVTPNERWYVVSTEGTIWVLDDQVWQLGPQPDYGGTLLGRYYRLLADPMKERLYLFWEARPDLDEPYNIYGVQLIDDVWQPIGVNSNSQSGLSNPEKHSMNVAVTSSSVGHLYVAYVEYETRLTLGDPKNSDIMVKRWDGSLWEPVGRDGDVTGNVSQSIGEVHDPRIVVAETGVVYLSWLDNSNGNRSEIFMLRLVENHWEELYPGSAGLAPVDMGHSTSWVFTGGYDLAMSPDGTPYLAWESQTDADDATPIIYLRRFTGATWETVYKDLEAGQEFAANSFSASRIGLVIAPDETVYLTWQSLEFHRRIMWETVEVIFPELLHPVFFYDTETFHNIRIEVRSYQP
ncbi:MAG: hypothetical protein KDE28_28170 [Anaerolineales bacterium]|nr:hypothetical protein [Anaerolineales bacterium]